jgi:hypothetical protein
MEHWTLREKKIARSVFDAALAAELAEVMQEFKSRAAAATEPGDMWSIQEYLFHMRQTIDLKYDYRYSTLLFVFGRLMREGWIEKEDLMELSEDKRAKVEAIASL